MEPLPNPVPVSTAGASAAPRSVDAGRGLAWWSEAWAMFMANPAMWIVLCIVLLVGFVVVGLIPLIGSLAVALISPVMAGSLMLAARKAQAGGKLEISDLFVCFNGKHLGSLMVLGGIVLAATILFTLVVGVLGVGTVAGLAAAGGKGAGAMAAVGVGLLGTLVALLFGMALALSMWFAPALVVFRDMPPVDALKLSVAATLKNLVAMLLYGVVYLVAAFVASIPLGLGWILLLPVTILTIYISYRDIFGD